METEYDIIIPHSEGEPLSLPKLEVLLFSKLYEIPKIIEKKGNATILFDGGIGFLTATFLFHFQRVYPSIRFSLRKNGKFEEKDSSYLKEQISETDFARIFEIDQDELNNVQNIITDLLYANYPQKDTSILSLSIVEALNNCFDHSEATHPPTVGFEYIDENSSGRLIAIIIDNGIGIPNKIISYFKETKGITYSERNAFFGSLIYRNTTKSRAHNQGRGLDNIVSLVRKLKGELNIYSNNLFYSYRHLDELNQIIDLLREHAITSLHGTVLLLSLPLENLPDKEEEELDF